MNGRVFVNVAGQLQPGRVCQSTGTMNGSSMFAVHLMQLSVEMRRHNILHPVGVPVLSVTS